MYTLKLKKHQRKVLFNEGGGGVQNEKCSYDFFS
jgi:hypothetical protein